MKVIIEYLFETVYESSEEQYYYYPETKEITVCVPGMEAIINKNFEFKTTFMIILLRYQKVI